MMDFGTVQILGTAFGESKIVDLDGLEIFRQRMCTRAREPCLVDFRHIVIVWFD